jgi:hypothetical protein
MLKALVLKVAIQSRLQTYTDSVAQSESSSVLLPTKSEILGVGLQPLRTTLLYERLRQGDAARTVVAEDRNQNSLQHKCLLPSAFIVKSAYIVRKFKQDLHLRKPCFFLLK